MGAACFSEACSAIDRMQTVIVKSALIKKKKRNMFLYNGETA